MNLYNILHEGYIDGNFEVNDEKTEEESIEKQSKIWNILNK